MLRKRISRGNTEFSSNMGHEFWLSSIGLQFHMSEATVNGRYDSWELDMAATVLDNVLLLVARFGNCIGYLYLGSTVNTMYKLYHSLEQKNGLDVICVITDKKKRYVQFMHRFFLPKKFLKGMLETLNTFSPETDEYMAGMNESRQPHESFCRQMLEKTEIKLNS